MLLQTDLQVKTVIHYNRSARAWQTIHVQSFGPGKDGKRAARLVALAQDNSQLFQSFCAIADRHEDQDVIIERLLDACELVANGHVYTDGKVRSQHQDQVIYTTHYDHSMWLCNCDAYHYNPTPSIYGPVCKHILARIMADMEGLELPT